MPANVTYTSISLSTVLGKASSGGVWKTITTQIALNDDSKSYKCSLCSSDNKLNITFTSDTALGTWKVLCTDIDASYDQNTGTLWKQLTNITADTSTSVSIPLTSDLFPTSAKSKYRISLYAKSQADGMWDVAELFMVYDTATSSYTALVPSDSSDGYLVASNA